MRFGAFGQPGQEDNANEKCCKRADDVHFQGKSAGDERRYIYAETEMVDIIVLQDHPAKPCIDEEGDEDRCFVVFERTL